MAIIMFKKTGTGEGIRTLDPYLGKIRLYEIYILNQLFIKLLQNPNTIRTFSTQFAQRALYGVYRLSCVPVILADPSLKETNEQSCLRPKMLVLSNPVFIVRMRSFVNAAAAYGYAGDPQRHGQVCIRG